MDNKALNYLRGTQREYSSKPLKHSIVKRILVFKQQIQGYFYPLKIFHLFGFPSGKSSGLKIIGIKTYLFKNFSQGKRLPEILGDLFTVKIRLKGAICTIFRCLIILGEAGKQARNLTKNVPKILYLKSSSKQIFSEN